MKKTLLPWLLALALCLCAACGPANSESSVSPEPDQPSEEESSSPEESPAEESAPEPPKDSGEMVTVTSFDGVEIQGKLRLPESGKAEKLVIYVNSSGPHTCDDRRSTGQTEFNYHDLFAEHFTGDGIAYFTYNTRGVTPGDTPPLFADIDDEAYLLYRPSNQVRDVEEIISALTAMEPLTGAKVYLLGWSEGTFIAPLVAQRGNVPVDALLLAGYMNLTMAETLEWQQSGGSSMVFYRQYFDMDGNGEISREEFEADPYGIAPYLGVGFEALDMTGDDLLTREDFALLLTDSREATLAAFNGGDNTWIAENYGLPLTSEWYLDFANFPPNKETLPTLALPIHIFHGQCDANVPVEEVYRIEADFQALGKDNLTVHVFDDADHDLDYMIYPTTGEVPEGIQVIFDVCKALS